MQRFYVQEIVYLSRELSRLVNALKEGSVDDYREEEILNSEVEMLKLDIESFDRLGLDMCVAHANRIIQKFNVKPSFIKNYEAIALYEELVNRLEDQCKLRYTVYLQPFAQGLLEPKTALFGPKVHEKFPSAIFDIQEAAACLAFERSTAAVMHMMRILEVGLKSLAKYIGIPYAPSWDAYIRKINSLLESEKYKSNTNRKKSLVLRDLAGDLLSIKHAWRNPSMHVDRVYGVNEALSLFRLTREVMTKISIGLSLKALPARGMKVLPGESSYQPQTVEQSR